MKIAELNKLLLERFPELNEKFDEITSWQEGIETGSFIVYEDVFMPFLEKNVKLNKTDLIERIYSFIEELASIEDDYVKNVLYVGILENIKDYKDNEKFSKYLKKKSKEIYKNM